MTSIRRDPDLVFFDRSPAARGPQPDWYMESGSVYITAPQGVRFMTLRWRGMFAPSCRVFGDAFERSYGDLEWRGLIPQRVMPWYCVVRDGERCAGYGVRVRPNAFCFWQVDEEGVSLTLDLRCGASPVYLREPLCAAQLVERTGWEAPYDFLRAFCEDMADGPVFAPHPVYGSNSWYYLYSASTGVLIRKDAALIAELTEGLDNRPYTVVDCGWSRALDYRDPCPGTALADGNEEFGDMKALAQDIKRLQVRPGLWLRPLCISNGAPVPESFILRRVVPGDYPCLDPSQPEALEIVAADVRKVVEDWGYELLKIDFTTYDLLGKFHARGEIDGMNGDWAFADTGMTTAMVMKALYGTIANNAGTAVIIGCNCVSHLSSGYFHLYRTGDDTSGQRFERTRVMGVNTLAYRLCQHKTFYDIDADCVGQTDGISWERNAQWLDLLSRSGTPLFVSIHPEKITPEQKQALREAYARASRQSERLEPLDFTDGPFPTRYRIDGREICYRWLDETGVVEFEG